MSASVAHDRDVDAVLRLLQHGHVDPLHELDLTRRRIKTRLRRLDRYDLSRERDAATRRVLRLEVADTIEDAQRSAS